jgi:acetyl/propionyl-CoA carboxylase alpha subunit
MRILIANRGEIARRIIRTAHRLGHQTVAAYADPDRDTPFVREASMAMCIGPARLDASYLSIDAMIDAAKRTGSDAVHPGYGFLAERADFARAVLTAGLTWVGPQPEAIACMGSKIEARRLAAAAGLPVIPGYDESQDPADLAHAAARIGYPVMVKASLGGGGKGIRVALGPEDFERSLREATKEAERAFGDGAVIIERHIERPRHIEVQVVGDRFGDVVELGTRECSLQRRYQKVIEEAPAPNLPGKTTAGLRAAAVRLARLIGYDSVGTMEFIVDDASGDYFFLEMNTRLQVEHPVTEFVTSLDLVGLQLLVAEGRPLPFSQEEIVIAGHAFEVRINAEDPWSAFIPQTGTVVALEVPEGARWESAIEMGTVVGSLYDPMVAKLIVGDRDRDTARRRMIAALDGLLIGGICTNTAFLRWLLTEPAVVDGRVTTRFIDERELPARPHADTAAARAARTWQAHRDDQPRADHVWSRIGRFRLTPHRQAQVVVLTSDDRRWEIPIESAHDGSGQAPGPVAVDLAGRRVSVGVEGASHTFLVPRRQDRWVPDTPTGGGGSAGALVAPFPATVTEVRVATGDHVEDGQVLIVIEAMKMLHSLTARGAGIVDEVVVRVGDQVKSKAVLITFRDNS